MLDLKDITRQTGLALKRNAPQLLTGIGITGMISTTIMAVRATPKALKRVEERKKQEQHSRLTPVQMIETAGPCYIPAAVTGVLSVGCLISSCAESTRRNAALATAYTLAESSLREYREKVVETIGERKETAILEAIDRDKVEKHPPEPAEIAYAEGSGQTLCYDAMFGRYFYSDRAALERAANDLNRAMSTMSEPYISLNQFYLEVGLPTTEIGDRLGWNVAKGLIDLRFSSQLADGHTPCLVMSYRVAPEYDYY